MLFSAARAGPWSTGGFLGGVWQRQGSHYVVGSSICQGVSSGQEQFLGYICGRLTGLNHVSTQCWLRLGWQFQISLAAVFSLTLGIHLIQGHVCHVRALADVLHCTQHYRGAAVQRFLPSWFQRRTDSAVASKEAGRPGIPYTGHSILPNFGIPHQDTQPTPHRQSSLSHRVTSDCGLKKKMSPKTQLTTG